ncbi:hypothetical protein AOC36_01985 [Erysipelothrix larvae]|uniref:BspA family leucine-rich repeat surface protein n=1 Tax=Erysipelothrix larvae TaxID=1514105 RepID=A0A0X8GYK0_9FIRM|nr:BspA family leucine-rich repeat surface protein [Erysipelothrix larvae]AMC92795.1 hypothetical protein AOC36_01985 [Erysipelothrix larvae]
MLKRQFTQSAHRLGLMVLISLFYFNPLYAAAYEDKHDLLVGTHGTSEWVITYDGILKIYDGEFELGTNLKWWDYKDFITKIEFVGNVIAHRNSTTLFGELDKVQEIVGLEKLDTTGVEVFQDMFRGMTSIKHLDLKGMNTERGINMIGMFSGMSQLESLDISQFDTSKLMYARGLFSGLSSLKSLDLSNFDTQNLVDARFMFEGMTSLVDLKMMQTDLRNLEFGYELLVGAPSIQSITLTETFSFGNDPDLFALHDIISSPMFDDTLYTGLWQNVGTGTLDNPLGEFIFSTHDLLVYYNGIEMADTYVWQPILKSEEESDIDLDLEIESDIETESDEGSKETGNTQDPEYVENGPDETGHENPIEKSEGEVEETSSLPQDENIATDSQESTKNLPKAGILSVSYRSGFASCFVGCLVLFLNKKSIK